jgi:hypothetical protein
MRIWILNIFLYYFQEDLEKFRALRIVVRIGSGVDNIDVKVAECVDYYKPSLTFFWFYGSTIAAIRIRQ